MERTQYMQQLMTQTYPQIPIEAVKGGYDGSWERLIAAKLKKDYDRGHSQACEICDSVNKDFIMAAHLITSSVIPENVTAY